MTQGIIYSCAGRTTFLTEAIKSANSVRKFLPNINICLFHNYSDEVLASHDTSVFTEFRKIVLPESTDKRFTGHMSWFLAKLFSIIETPYENCLFLDTDTEIRKPIGSLFKLLNKFDIAIAPGPMTQPPIDSSDVLTEIPNEFPELNTGVILYKMNSKMKSFLIKWKQVFLHNIDGLYRVHGKGGEQVSLRYLLWTHEEIRMHIFSTQGMPNMYNFRWGPLDKEFKFDNKVVIHHTRYK